MMKQLIYYIIDIKSLFYRDVYLFENNMILNFYFTPKSNCFNFLKTSAQVNNEES